MSSRVLRKLAEGSQNQTDENDDSNDDCEKKHSIFSKFSNYSPEQQIKISSSDECPVADTKPVKCKKRKKRSKQKEKAEDVTDQFDNLSLQNEVEICDQKKELTELLKVNSKMLDHVAELNRLFRSEVTNSRTSSRKKQIHKKHGGLVMIKPTWPLAVRTGLSMEPLGCGLYTFVHSKEYQNVQRLFHSALESMNVNFLNTLLYENPYHIHCLLQLSEIMMHQEDTTMAIDLLERVLHAFQSAFHHSFNPLNASCRLDFKHQINRGLFVALFRYILSIGERGCYRSALEYCKLLLSLDYEGDPLTVLLMIDQYAVFSGQYSFLIDLFDSLNESRNLDLLPNFAFSIPLARKLAGEDLEKSDGNKMSVNEALQDALIMFPGFVTRLLKHTSIGGIGNLDKSILFGKELLLSESESLGHLISLYVARMHSLWSSPNILPWLEKNIESVLAMVEPKQIHPSKNKTIDPRLAEYSKRRKALYPAFPPKILRHLFLSGVPEAPPVLPRNLVNTPIYAFDPFPPKNSIDICKKEAKKHIYASSSSDGFFTGLLTSLLPSSSFQYPVAEPSADSSSDAGAADSENNTLGIVNGVMRNASESVYATLRQVLERIDIRFLGIGNEEIDLDEDDSSFDEEM
ncbi:unnamed protein product [Trichobilharzia szidati]|nr:unnamed protein product [Trichobilharzia szidati]